jgi:putative flippase GtrA
VQILRFAVIGTLGFIIDSSILVVLAKGLGVPPLPARITSFLCAATVTYLLNRTYTFRATGPGPGRWLRYVLITGIGALINIGTYHAWISAAGTTATDLVLGSAIGSVLALFFNFFASRHLVFRLEASQR